MKILLVIVIIIAIFIYLYFFNKSDFVPNLSIVKYPIKKELKNFKKIRLKDVPKNVIWYTTVPWKARKGNYLKFKKNYYIIEPGYYYLNNDSVELFTNNNILIFYKEIK